MSKLFFATHQNAGHGESYFGIGFRTPERMTTREDADAKAESLNETWGKLAAQTQRDHLRLSRVSYGGFWVTPVDEFNDLTPGEVLHGSPFKQRREPVTRFQQEILDEPFQKRFQRVLDLIDAPDPATVIA
ncbi:hypothetical protein [Cupriavidus numazuensis]|uniref:Uncharacterized protein n=1 Tax=Cupriavidus numazuensis TaxID=221992 RepID=A0ABM8TBU5_9BURK|nr:hypothetical protein [Cupriavidus numazuensis]CAG2132375.1 hypothetical protein LMG26411_00607 [Cupriavidus numazuensis]